MSRLSMNFAARRERPVGLVLTVVGLAVAAAGAALYTSLAGERDGLAAELATLERRARGRVPAVDAAKPARQREEETKLAAAIARKLALPWSTLFGELEEAAAGDVTLLSVEPDAANRRLQLTGEAKSFEALVKYIGRLEEREGLAEVWLANHEMKPAGSSKRVAFTLVARWLWNG